MVLTSLLTGLLAAVAGGRMVVDLKAEYDQCVTTFMRTKLVQGQFENPCEDIFLDYKDCVTDIMKARFATK